jgi:hypothetical protein
MDAAVLGHCWPTSMAIDAGQLQVESEFILEPDQNSLNEWIFFVAFRAADV